MEKGYGGILIVANIPGFLKNLKDFYEKSDEESDDLRLFIRAWWNEFARESVGAKELYQLIIDQELSVESLMRGKTPQGQKASLGKLLVKLRDRVIGHYKIIPVDEYANRKMFKLDRKRTFLEKP